MVTFLLPPFFKAFKSLVFFAFDFLIFAGAFTVSFFDVFLNAPFFTVLRAVPFFKVIVFNCLQPLKAFLLITFTFFPRLICFNFLKPLNALLPICTTLHDTLLIFTFAGMVTFFLFTPFFTIAVFLFASSTL